MVWIKVGEASKRIGVSIATLRKWADSGRIKSIRTPGETRLYDVDSFFANGSEQSVLGQTCERDEEAGTETSDRRVDIAYCRVSSAGQKADLKRQVAYLKERCPGAEIIKDVGSGLNFKRKGLKALLERALQGHIRSVTIAHKDRLCRFGFELIRWLLERQQVELVVLNNPHQSSESEFTEDLMAIVHVFSCRFNGLRRYRQAVEEAVEGQDGDQQQPKRRKLQDAQSSPSFDARSEGNAA
jgi:excisionase family DNA binding protein